MRARKLGVARNSAPILTKSLKIPWPVGTLLVHFRCMRVSQEVCIMRDKKGRTLGHDVLRKLMSGPAI